MAVAASVPVPMFPGDVGEVGLETRVEVWMCVSTPAMESSWCSGVVVRMALLNADAGVRMVLLNAGAGVRMVLLNAGAGVRMIPLSSDVRATMVPRLAINKMGREVSPPRPPAEVMVVNASPETPGQPPFWSCNVPSRQP